MEYNEYKIHKGRFMYTINHEETKIAIVYTEYYKVPQINIPMLIRHKNSMHN